MRLTFTVPGVAKPQGSKRAFVHPTTGKAIVVESAGQPLKDWRASFGHIAREVAPDEPLDGPLAVRLVFSRRRPKAHHVAANRERPVKPYAPALPTTTPDLDKLCRAALDAMTSILFADDAQVVRLTASKVYGPDETRVDVESLTAVALREAA